MTKLSKLGPFKTHLKRTPQHDNKRDRRWGVNFKKSQAF